MEYLGRPQQAPGRRQRRDVRRQRPVLQEHDQLPVVAGLQHHPGRRGHQRRLVSDRRRSQSRPRADRSRSIRPGPARAASRGARIRTLSIRVGAGVLSQEDAPVDASEWTARGVAPRSPACRAGVLLLDQQPHGIESPRRGRPGRIRTCAILLVRQASLTAGRRDERLRGVAREGVEPSDTRTPEAGGFSPVCLPGHHQSSSGGWNRTSGLRVQSAASLPAATAPGSERGRVGRVRGEGFEPPTVRSKAGWPTVGRSPSCDAWVEGSAPRESDPPVRFGRPVPRRSARGTAGRKSSDAAAETWAPSKTCQRVGPGGV